MDSFDHDFDKFDIFSQGATAMSSLVLEEYFDHNLRFFAEECDFLRGFHVLVDATQGWGNAADLFFDELKQEYATLFFLYLFIYF